jgi:hypothetical protein
VFPDTQALVDFAKTIVPRCLTATQRARLFLDVEPPAWCRQMAKWPHVGNASP